MTLIITNTTDVSSINIMEWLKYMNKPYICITDEDEIEIKEYSPKDTVAFSVNGKEIKVDEIKSVWYRRGYFNYKNYQFPEIGKDDYSPYDTTKLFKRQHYKEIDTLIEYLHYRLNKKMHINYFYNSEVNKLVVLDKAIECGLLIPPTKICTHKKQVEQFIQDNKSQIITKTATSSSTASNSELIIYCYTEVIDLKKLTDTFFPSMFQKMIEKEFEIRIFFLDTEFYAMAIFSQNDEQTMVDFRKYNRNKPNRTVPFLLPKTIESKLKKLVALLQLNCGSIDMIYSKDNKYYFLEINPIGQFGMVSLPCNYYLEKRIAEYL